VPGGGKSLEGTRIESATGAVLYAFDGKVPPPAFLPAPAQMPVSCR